MLYKKLSTAAVLYLIAGWMPLQAQLAKQGLQQLPRALGKNVLEETATAAAWKNFSGVLPVASSAAANLPNTRAPRSFKEQVATKYPGAVAAYEQKINKLSLQQSLRKVVELRGLTPPKGWPQKSEHSLTVPHLSGLTLDGYKGKFPPLPIPTNKIYLYRGMGLHESALRNVLKNGLRVQDSGKHSNDLDVTTRLTTMGTMPVSSQMMKDMDIRQTYLTPNAQETLHYAYMYSFEEGKIPVVVTVRGWRKGNSHHVFREDIPASDFVEVSALIQGPQGEPVWCSVTLAKDGSSFVFTPYVPKP